MKCPVWLGSGVKIYSVIFTAPHDANAHRKSQQCESSGNEQWASNSTPLTDQIIFLPRGMSLNKAGQVGLNTLLLWVCLFSSHSESLRGTNDMLACFSHYSEQLRTEKEQLCRWFLQNTQLTLKKSSEIILILLTKSFYTNSKKWCR